jgi:hypothetical protein
MENNNIVIIKEETSAIKNKRIKVEIKRLNNFYKNLSEELKKTYKSLIENAAFMIVSLEDLQREINLNGYTSLYKNGENQFGTKKSPEIEIYLTMIKNYVLLVKQLNDFLPDKAKNNSTEEPFLNFVNKRDD